MEKLTVMSYLLQSNSVSEKMLDNLPRAHLIVHSNHASFSLKLTVTGTANAFKGFIRGGTFRGSREFMRVLLLSGLVSCACLGAY